jgi:hypothetical protein
MSNWTSFMNDPNVLAQFGHAGIPYGMLLTVAKYNWHFWPIAVGLLGYAALKEFWFDANYEVPHQTFANNMTDFSFYCLGIGLAMLVYFH